LCLKNDVLLVVCPNLALDRILQVSRFQPTKVQRSHSVLVQPGGKGSNVARVFRQLGGEVALIGFVGRRNGAWIRDPLRGLGIHVEAIEAYDGESRTCTIICDSANRTHPTVNNEESSEVEPAAINKLLRSVDRWMGRADAVLVTGSISLGLPSYLYAEILDRARGRITAIDATGDALRAGLSSRPMFMKPNAEEFLTLTSGTDLIMLPEHTAITCGANGATLIHRGRHYTQQPPQVFDINPIGAGDAFVAGYLKGLLDRRSAEESFHWAMTAGACDAATIRPGFIEGPQFRSLLSKVASRFI
jgi:tagatose 6-phosphate kinase